MLEACPDLTEHDRRASLDAMDRGASGSGRVIDDLLLLSKVGDPNHPIIPVPVDLRPVVDEVLDLSSVAGAAARRSTIRVRGSRRAGAGLGDPEELDRVCANLVSNAVKYTPDGRSITVVAWPARTTRSCSLSPTRASASPTADQDHLFTSSSAPPTPRPSPSPAPAWAWRSCSGSSTGTAAGSTSRSELGHGSTFTVRLPAAA